MKRTRAALLPLLSLALVLAVAGQGVAASPTEEATFFPTYGYLDPQAAPGAADWIIPLRLWVHERRAPLETYLTKLIAGARSAAEQANFQSRISDFVAYDKPCEEVFFSFDNDPQHERFQVRTPTPRLLPLCSLFQKTQTKTDGNGLVVGSLRLSGARAAQLLYEQNSVNGRLTFRATADGEHVGTGRVRLLPPSGLSVVSDIDDTIKITEILKGPTAVIENTFFRPFRAAPGMAERYQRIALESQASFHYVTGSPWQLYRRLSEFLVGGMTGFPEGSFHMKDVPKDLLTPSTYADLGRIIGNPNATYDQKVQQITQLMRHFPGRFFVLIGDSGEMDPEVYATMRARFPAQVLEILIRDVRCDQTNNPARLAGMTVIRVPECQ